MKIPTILLSISLCFFVATATAQNHQGRMDTDGVLSPGEIPNPRINYNNKNGTVANPNTHVGQVDTDGILSPGEIPNRNIDYGSGVSPSRPGTSAACDRLSRRDIGRPRVDLGRVKSTGNIFGDKVKVRGSVEGTCLTEAGLFENGRKVQNIPINTTDRFNRFEFEVKADLGEYPEIRVYNTTGERDIQEVRDE